MTPTISDYNNNANSIHDEKAVKNYREKCNVQTDTFQHLISFENIEKGWNIIDIGCGTGNNTALLAEIVGKEGKVIGTDPIKERVEEATQSFKRTNLKFAVDFAKNSFKYGKNFNVAFANFIIIRSKLL